VTLRVWPWSEPAEPTKRFGSCCGTDSSDDARHVARALGIPYYLLNIEREFDHAVVGPFADAYRRGETPVPCLACNSELKFGSLLRRARAWEAAAVATGHYARVTRDAATGRYLLLRAVDPREDQTDFLGPLTQTQPAPARLPVGALTKDEVGAHARRLVLSAGRRVARRGEDPQQPRARAGHGADGRRGHGGGRVRRAAAGHRAGAVGGLVPGRVRGRRRRDRAVACPPAIGTERVA